MLSGPEITQISAFHNSSLTALHIKHMTLGGLKSIYKIMKMGQNIQKKPANLSNLEFTIKKICQIITLVKKKDFSVRRIGE
jgi:hypothetical protein